MTFLPIVDRELRVAARLKSTYRNRALAAGIVAAVAVVMLVFGELAPFPSQVGRAMFATLSHLTLIICLLEGVRKTADCISEERREGTLGLLFLTDLRGYDVVLGKMAGASLNSIYGLLAILPVLALSLLLGGVTEGEFWRMALALLNALFFSLAAGMLVSAYSQNERAAMSGTVLLVLGWVLIPLFIPVHAITVVSPAHTFRAAFEAYFRGPTPDFWPSLLVTQSLAWGFLGWSSLVVTRFGRNRQWRFPGHSSGHDGTAGSPEMSKSGRACAGSCLS